MNYASGHGFDRDPALALTGLVIPPAGLGAVTRRAPSDVDAAFAAGIALKSLDDLIRADPPWLGCWRDRFALKSATVAARMFGRSGEETAIRDAVLLTGSGDDPGPAGKLFWPPECSCAEPEQSPPLRQELATLLGMKWDDGLASIPDMVDTTIQSGRLVPSWSPS